MKTAKQVPNRHKGMFKPGQSGNPKGRPKKEHTLTSLIRDELAKVCSEDKQGRTYEQLLAEAIVKGAVKKAISGDGRLAELILERTEGKVTQPVTGEGGGPIRTESIVYQVVDEQTAEMIKELRG